MPAASTLVTSAWPLANAGTQLVDPMTLVAMAGMTVTFKTSAVLGVDAQKISVRVTTKV